MGVSAPARPLRITFVMADLSRNGGTRVLAEYAARLRARGHHVEVVAKPAPKPSLRRRIKALLQGRRVARPASSGSFFHDRSIETRVLERHRALTDHDVPDADVIVATWWATSYDVARLAPSKGAKVYFMQDYGIPGQLLEQVVPTWSLPLSIITIAPWLVQLIQTHVDKPVDLVPNAVDTGVFHAPPRGKQPIPTVGFVYAPLWSKGCDLCLAAVQQARRELPDLRVVACGAAEDPEFPLPRWIEHHSRVADEELRRIYSRCDAWLFGSRLEGFGLPILEAMACRTPVIGTRAGAAPELLADGGGILVQRMHADEMARAIVRVCRMPPSAWREMSDAAHATATRYTWDDATTLMEAAFRRAVARARSGGHACGSLAVVGAT